MTKSISLTLRILALVLCLACLVSGLQPVSAVPVEEVQEATQQMSSMTTKVHNGAYASATVIGQMEQGTCVTVLGQLRDFYKVDCYGMTGYIAKSQIRQDADGKYYVNCQEGSSETGSVSYYTYEEALNLRSGLLSLAKEQLGEPYIYGSAGPYGFDCSGLMYYLYGNHGVELHRTASQQLQDGIVVAKEGLQVGDLIFFREPGDSYPASHVGIYAGDNKIIHAGHQGIVYADLDFDYFYEYYLCARRIINTQTVEVEEVVSAMTVANVLTRTAPVGRRTSN